MRRRDYLRASGVAGISLVAGCTGTEDMEEAAEVTESSTATESQAQTTGTTSADAETATETETGTTTPEGEPKVTIREHELVVDEGEYTTDVYVAAKVTNEGNAPTSMVELTAEWYDAEGNYLGNITQYLQSLGTGETWAARVYYLGSDPKKVDDYEFDGKFGTESPIMNSEGLELLGSEMKAGTDEVVISGEVKNNRDEMASYIQATGKVYNGNDVVLTDEWTNVTEVPAGETWAFEVTWLGGDRVAQAADHTVWITDSAL